MKNEIIIDVVGEHALILTVIGQSLIHYLIALIHVPDRQELLIKLQMQI